MRYSEEEQRAISDAYRKLTQELSVGMDSDRLAFVDKAFRLSLEKFDGEYLVSGKPKMLRTIQTAEVAGSEIGLGSIITVACMLNGILSKEGVTAEYIEKEFGKSVSSLLVEYDLKSVFNTQKVSYQSESFRKMALSLTSDVRAVFMAVVQRLYDMRNLDDVSPDLIENTVNEVKYLTIPVVHRLGWYNVKYELENILMKYEIPDVYESIKSKITQSKDFQNKMMNAFIEPIKEGISALEPDKNGQPMDCTIKWRTKSIPSIYAKMKAQNVDFEHVYDIFAIRIIINNSLPKNEVEDCWRVYSVVTNIYSPNPSRLRDWISKPKDSGYESLHTTVKYRDGWVEVQIRTKRMDDIAERGTAAHWQYKSTFSRENEDDWLNQIRQVVENPKDFDFDVVSTSMQNHKADKIYIITPEGDLKQLPVGSTVLDFAYGIHSEVGSICSGAKVNDRVVPIRHVLCNGDKVEIITNRNQKPRADWLNYVTTEKAKNKIRRFLQEENLKYAEYGKAIFLRKLRNWKFKPSDEMLNEILKELKLGNASELYSGLYDKTIDIAEIKKIIFRIGKDDTKVTDRNLLQQVHKKTDHDGNNQVLFEGMDDVSCRFARCCNPIHGDDIFGFITTSGTGITIHRKGCPNAMRLRQKYPYRVVEARWNDGLDGSKRIVNVRIVASDVIGVLGDITNVISNELKMNMVSLLVDSRSDKMIEGRIAVEVSDNDELETLLQRLRKIKGMKEAFRDN